MRASTITLCLALAGAAAGQEPKPSARRLPPLMELPTYPVLKREAVRLVVDGSLHEWPAQLPGLILDDPRQVSGTANKSFRGPTDVRARGAAMWDGDRLWFRFAVADDWGRPFRTNKRAPTRLLLPPADSIVLYFDPRRDTRSYGPDPGRSEDREYWIGMTHEGGTFCVSCRRRFATATLETETAARVLYDRKLRAYSIEVSVPWSELLGDETPREGMAIDFQVVVNDFDDPTDPLPQTRVGWTFGVAPKIDPALYGTLLLVGSSWRQRALPERPPLPDAKGELPDKKFWIDLSRNVAALPPEPGKKGASGKRRDLLRALDAQFAEYPLVDHQELMMLMQREMPRELAGYLDSGPPYFFELVMQDVLRGLRAKWPHDTPGVVALPGRGFLVRSKEGTVALSPASVHAQRLAPALCALLFANSSDPLDRHDPLMRRVLARKPEPVPVFCHVSFHLPGYGPLRPENLSNPGFTKKVGDGIEVRVLGKRDEKGRVTATAGYQLTWPKGFTVVHTSLGSLPEQVRLPDGKERVDVLILDPDNPAAELFVQELEPRAVILEGFLDAPRWAPRMAPRNHRLDEIDATLERFGDAAESVVLLAPGQVWR